MRSQQPVARHAGVGVCVALSCVVAVNGQGRSLGAEDIVHAIAWGQSGQPEAYTLRSPFPANKTPPGIVYTPYLRVALAARAARESGRVFTSEDVTEEMTAPLIYFAIGDAGADPLPPGSLPPDTPLRMRLVTHHSEPRSPLRREVAPVWLSRDIPEYLRFGLRPNWSYVLGAFPVRQVTADSRIELYREFRSGSHRQVVTAPALITDTDLKIWK